MSVSILINKLKKAQVKVDLVDDQLKISAPKGAISPDLLAELKMKKDEIVAFIKTHSEGERYFEKIEPISQSEYYEVSHAQKRLWILSSMEKEQSAYNISGAYLFKGELNKQAFEEVFKAVIERHESLRTTFMLVEGDLKQQIHSSATYPFKIQYFDFRSNPEKEQIIKELAEKDVAAPFDLINGPLLRTTLLHAEDDLFVCLFTMHHIISDAWSLSIFLKGIIELYNDYSVGKKHELPRLSIQYKDYAAWQNNKLKGQSLKRHQNYWLDQFQGEIPVLDLPTDFPRPATKTYAGDKVSFTINDTLTQSLTQLSHEGGASLFMTLLAAVKTLLYRYTGQDDIIVGSPVTGREHPDLSGQIGFFVNTLPLRTHLDGHESFQDLLYKVKNNILEAYEHQIYPFDCIVEDLNLGRDLSRSPLFDVAVILQNASGGQDAHSPSLQSISVAGYETNKTISKFDLSFNFNVTNEALSVTIEYNPDLFARSRILRLSQHFTRLTGSILKDAKTPLNKLQYISDSEQSEILHSFNNTLAHYPADSTIQELFEHQVKKNPNATALIYNGHRITYDELNKQANRLAHHLREDYKLIPDNIVGLMINRSEQMIVGILGIIKAGCAYLPVDPEQPKERIAYVLKDADIRVMLTSLDLVLSLTEFYGGEIFALDAQITDLNTPTDNLPNINKPTDLAYVIYTSGSTGQPKGVMIEHRSNINMALDQIQKFEVTSEDRVLQFASLSFDASVYEIFMAFYAGAALVLVDKPVINDAILFTDYIKDSEVSIVTLPPSYLNTLDRERLSFLRIIITAGEAPNIEDALYYSKKLGYYNAYGPTECAVCVTVNKVLPEASYPKSIPIGSPISNTRIYILDNNLNLVPQGVAGEICVGGDGLARGYLKRDELTNEKFITNPFNLNERLYRTGDLGVWLEDGQIEFVGRKDEQIKLRGYRIELGEIENRLSGFESIENSLVLAKENTEGDKRLIAYYISREELNPKELKFYLEQYLPEYMIPSYFIWLEDFPRTSSGKINKKALSNPEEFVFQKEYIAPSGKVELKLTEIWQEALHIEKIGIRDNFFEIGGHSLKAIQILGRIYKELDARLDLNMIFLNPTIESLAGIIQNSSASVYKSIEKIPEGQEYYEVSYSQKRLWIIHRLSPELIAYNLPAAYHYKGQLESEVLSHAFYELVRRHESLRTTFVAVNGEPKQKIHNFETFGFKMQQTDLRNEANKEAIAREIAGKEANTIFDLENGPLIRVHLVCLNSEEYLILITMHHIISDRWSMEVMIKELLILYNAYSHGTEYPLNPLPIQYKDYSAWQNTQLSGDNLDEHQKYWLNHFSGEIPVLALPTDYPRPAIKTYNGDNISFLLDKEISDRLIAMSFIYETSLFVVILAAIKALLHKYSGQEDIIIGSPIAGRDHADLEDQVGFYVNILALKTKFSAKESFENLLKQVKDTTLGAFNHQIYPFDKLVDELNPGRDISRSPLYDVGFNWHTSKSPANHVQQDAGFSIEEYSVPFKISKADLWFHGSNVDDQIVFSIEYNTDLYQKSSIERCVEHFKNLLKSFVEDPQKPLYQVDYITPAEKSQWLNIFNDTTIPYSKNETLQELFEKQVQKHPDNIAVVFNEVRLTYKELNEHSNRLAHYLRNKYSLKPDDLVAVMMERSEYMIIALLGIIKSGAAYLPIDSSYPQERIKYILMDSSVGILLVDNLEPIQFDGLNCISLPKIKDEIQNYSTENTEIISNARCLAYVTYTSGSTGLPKGVMVEQWSVSRLAIDPNYIKFSAEDRLLQTGSLAFDASTFEIWSMLLNGGSLYLTNPTILLDAFNLERIIKDENINMLFITTSWFNELCDTRVEVFNTLKWLLTGGDKLSVRHINQVRIACPELTLINCYGPTENTTFSSFYLIDRVHSGAIPIGKPVSNSTMYILDEGMNLVPEGVTGEIYVGGDGLARGYWKKDALTEEKFVYNTFLPEAKKERLYKTGDLGKYRKGNIDFVGRNDNQIKLRGYRIELGEIENALLKQKTIEKAVVVPSEDKAGEKQLIAYYTSAEALPHAELKAFVGAMLPYYMIPSYFIHLEAFPITVNGKIDLKALTRPLAETTSIDYVAPRDTTEKVLAEIWKEVLDRSIVGVNDNFFEVGGNSIKLIKLHHKLEELYPGKIKITDLFNNATVSSQATLFKGNSEENTPDEGQIIEIEF